MKQAQLIYITGDTHMEWDGLNDFINQEIRHGTSVADLIAKYDELEILIFVCGDFGYWPHLHGQTLVDRDKMAHWLYVLGHLKQKPEDRVFTYDQYCLETRMDGIRDGHIKIYWCDGNHENHDALDALEADHPDQDFIPIMPWVFFARFGSVLTLLDGTRVMFCGGARSSDMHCLQEGESWWPGEEIDAIDMTRLPDPEKERIHWVISHTCPEGFKVVDFDRHSDIREKDADPSRRHLERIRRFFMPDQWWFGHYHLSQPGMLDGCRWMALDCLDRNFRRRWFETRMLTLDKKRPQFFERRGKRVDGMTTVFFDTEFSALDYPELISLGAITEDGSSEFYAEISPLPERCSDFVHKRVLPLLTGPAYPHDELAWRFLQWLDGIGTDICMVSDASMDRDLLEELYERHPILQPGEWRRIWEYRPGTCGFGVHHALEDARELRAIRIKYKKG